MHNSANNQFIISSQLPPYEVTSRRGCFIAIDGLDGSGLSTQVDRLCEWLSRSGHPFHKTKEPSAGPFGAQIRLNLAKRLELDELTIALAFATDRADHLSREILPALQRGINVISDRYLLSSFAYQGPHVDSDWLERVSACFPLPDLTIFLDVPPHICMRRMKETRWHLEKNEQLDELTIVYEHFHKSIKLMQSRGANIEIIAHSEEKDVIHQQIVERVAMLPLICSSK